MPRQIEVSNGQVDHVGKRIEMTEATGPILNDLDDAIEALGNGVGYAGADEGQHRIMVAPEGMDELAQRLQTTERLIESLLIPCFHAVSAFCLGAHERLVGQAIEILGTGLTGSAHGHADTDGYGEGIQLCTSMLGRGNANA